METYSVTLNKLLLNNPSQFQVPVFQRSYTWGEQQLERLWSAICRQMEIGKRHPDHFMGAIVVTPQASGNLSIVDGQQRLVTLQVLIAVIGARAASASLKQNVRQCLDFNVLGGTEPKVIAGPKDRAEFEQIRSLEAPGGDDQNHQLGHAWRFFDSRLAELTRKGDSEVVLKKLLKVILERLRFIQIITDKDANPQEIFETLNHDGLRLDQVDLIRNYLFMNVAKKADTVYNSTWLELETELPGQQMNNFLLSWSLFEARVTGSAVRPQQNNLFVTLRDLTRASEGDQDAMAGTIQRIASEAGPFIELTSPAQMSVKATKTERCVQSVLEDFQNWGPRSLEPVLYQLHWYWRDGSATADDYLKALLRLEAFSVRWMLAGFNQSPLTSVFRTMAQSDSFRPEDASLASAVKFCLKEITKNGKVPDNEVILSQLLNNSFYKGDRQHRFVLRHLTQAWQQKSSGGKLALPPYHPDAKQITKPSWSIDHVMPQDLKKWKPDLKRWGFTVGEAQLSMNLIGNLCLVPKAVNPAIGNSPWGDKKAKRSITGDPASMTPRSLSRDGGSSTSTQRNGMPPMY